MPNRNAIRLSSIIKKSLPSSSVPIARSYQSPANARDWRKRRSVLHAFLAVIAACLVGCGEISLTINEPLIMGEPDHVAAVSTAQHKVGVLLVSHGSHSPVWRKMLRDFHDSVSPELLELPGIEGVKSSFMEYTEPSIATKLKAFDHEDYTHVILVPLLLTVSSHSFDDIPTIIGAKDDHNATLMLKAEGIEQYTPTAQISITELLDFSDLLQENLPRRILALSENPSSEGVVLVAYGCEIYDQEWHDFFHEVGRQVQDKTGVAEITHTWCGHIVRYSKIPVQQSIRKILETCDRAIVIPVLVARDEFFQDEVIGGAIDEMDEKSRVVYLPDAILPERKLNEWVVLVTQRSYEQIRGTWKE